MFMRTQCRFISSALEIEGANWQKQLEMEGENPLS